MYLLLVTFETNDNYSIQFEMKKRYSHSSNVYPSVYQYQAVGRRQKQKFKYIELQTGWRICITMETNMLSRYF